MVVGEHIHWYVTGRCNIDPECSYCFKPETYYSEAGQRLTSLAGILVDNGIKQTTITGGEPLLVRELDDALRILKDGGVYVSLHTNGILLDDKRLNELTGLVDDIALPIDTTRRAVQKELRGDSFMKTFHKLLYLARDINKKNITLGYHTVFADPNKNDMKNVYKFINQHDFNYWRVYEYNEDLRDRRVFDKAKLVKGPKETDQINKEWDDRNILCRPGTEEKGYTDYLFANFLLVEEQMKSLNDDRITFVGRMDPKPIYAFLDNSGDISHYMPLSFNRKLAGNILNTDFSKVMQTLADKESEEFGLDDDHLFTSLVNRPIWARLWDGEFRWEELEAIKPKYQNKFSDLAKLYLRRVARLEKESPESAEEKIGKLEELGLILESKKIKRTKTA